MEEFVFKYIEIEVPIQAPYGIFTRSYDTAVVLVRDLNNQWVLGQKVHFYPDGISRMLGGGMDENEHPATAAVRELQEEVGVVVDEDRMTPLIHAQVVGHLPDGKKAERSVFVFYAALHEPLKAADDVSGLVHLTDRELLALVNHYAQLPETPIRTDEAGTWQNYGQVWGPIHAEAFERVKELGL